jgi:hypothetical protein
MELEKLRQARVLNEYMNEMLQMNQKWIEENTKLQNRIHELEDERVELINDFKAKIEDFSVEVESMKEHVILAVKEHFTVVNTLRAKIAELEDIIIDKEAQIKALKDALENPFGESGEAGPSQLDVDLSQEYAIMDITGQGDDIVAKLVNIDGTTFTVHKGSMLKGGEVVSAITDTYISFESKGVKSYLYTGGSVREYEPAATFNDGSEDFFEQTEATAMAKAKMEANALANDNKSTSKNARDQKQSETDKDGNNQSKINKPQKNNNKDDSDSKSSSSDGPSRSSSGAPVSSRSMFAR